MASFELEGQRFNALNGGPNQVQRGDLLLHQRRDPERGGLFLEQTHRRRRRGIGCGWLKDKFGLSWQVVPTALGRYSSDPDRKKADRAMQAMMKMQKIVIADLDKAYNG